MTKKSVLGVNITIDSKDDILENIKKYLDKIKNQKSKIKNNKTKPFVIYTPNPEIITYAQKDSKFKQIVATAQINIPDGMGVAWALKKIYGINIGRLTGIDLMLDLCRLAEKERLTIGLIGGRGGVAVETRECLLKTYPKLKIEVLETPEVIVSGIKYQVLSIKDKNILNTKYVILNTEGNQEEKTEKYFNNLVKEIVEKKIDILFVALGFPKQEYFIDSIKYQVSSIKYDRPLLMMAVGGTFDYLAGRVPRAPKWIRDAGFEWLYRLIREPWRLSRQIKGAEFFLKITLFNSYVRSQ